MRGFGKGAARKGKGRGYERRRIGTLSYPREKQAIGLLEIPPGFLIALDKRLGADWRVRLYGAVRRVFSSVIAAGRLREAFG